MTDLNAVTDPLATLIPPVPSTSADPSTAAAPTDPTASADPGAKAQSPLDVLDQILNEAQAKATDNLAKQEEQEKKLIAAELERQKKEDQERIAKQIIDLQKMKQSPEYLARLEHQQDEEKKEEEYEEKMDGMQIVQLGHTKI